MTRTIARESGWGAVPVRKAVVIAAALAAGVLAQVSLNAQYTPEDEAPATRPWASAVVDTSAAGASAAPAGVWLRALMLGEGGGYGPAGPEGPDANQNATPPPVFRALFCRFDDDLDERKIPLRLRAGDLETVNKLERKPGW